MSRIRAAVLLSVACFAASAASGCASRLPAIPSNVRVGSIAALPSARPAANDAAPVLLAAAFSSLDVARGQTWSGAFSTTTNVASVEVRTNLFSIDVPRTSYGRFAFHVAVYDTPSIFLRKYAVRVIARNSAGVQTEEDLPFQIR